MFTLHLGLLISALVKLTIFVIVVVTPIGLVAGYSDARWARKAARERKENYLRD